MAFISDNNVPSLSLTDALAGLKRSRQSQPSLIVDKLPTGQQPSAPPEPATPASTTLAPPRLAARRWTQEQQQVLSCADACIHVKALAGTGKTDVLREYARRRPAAKWAYLVFNKAIQQAVQGVLPTHVSCSTWHAHAYRRLPSALTAKSSLPDLDDPLLSIAHGPGMPRRGRSAAAALLRETLQAFMHSDDEAVAWRHVPQGRWAWWQRWSLADQWWSEPEAIVAAATRLWAAMMSERYDLHTPLDAWLKVWQLSGTGLSADGLLLDEAQDLTPVMLSIINHSNAITKVFAGDPHQTVYQWRTGAPCWPPPAQDSRAMLLSKSFRFGQCIAHQANDMLALLGPDRLVGGQPDDQVFSGWPSDTTDALPPSAPDRGVSPSIRLPEGANGAVCLSRTWAGGLAFAHRYDRRFIMPASTYQRACRWLNWFSARRSKAPPSPSGWVEGMTYERVKQIAHETGDQDMLSVTSWLEAVNIEQARHQVEDSQLSNGPDSVGAKGPLSPSSKTNVPGRLHLMTAHGSKGKAFDTVWLAEDFGLSPASRNPHSKTSNQPVRWDAEEIRLVYMAQTRARAWLGMTPDLMGALRAQARMHRQADAHVDINSTEDDGF